MIDENGVTEFRKGVIYGERLERARIIALLNTKQLDIMVGENQVHIETHVFEELITEIKETA